jgi:putative effector of murein hydrolase
MARLFFGPKHQTTEIESENEVVHGTGDSQRSQTAAMPKTLSEASSMVSNQGVVHESRAEVSQPRGLTDHVQLPQYPSPPSSPLQDSLGGKEAQGSGGTRKKQGLLPTLTYLFWALTILVGIPVRFKTDNEMPLEIFLLFAIWFSTVVLQQSLRSEKTKFHRPRLSVILSSLLNPVLWTSLLMMAYAWTEAARSARSINTVLDFIQTNVSFADMLFHNTPAYLANLLDWNVTNQEQETRDTSTVPMFMGAGDIALAILNAGLVSWGLKLYKCRRQLLSLAGVTVVSVASLLALGNVVLGPLLVKAVGLPGPDQALAFAARSVTLALGTPALTALGGDLSLNAAMVDVNGILFQMGLGLGLDVWIAGVMRRALGPQTLRKHVQSDSVEDVERQDDSSAGTSNITRVEEQNMDVENDRSRWDLANQPGTVAAGVTIGINSAAMGTAHLYEVGNPAAPYSTLSMTALGVMTVVFCSIGPMTHWVQDMVR